MAHDDGQWSVRANYWQGDRALGGHLKMSSGRLGFDPHGLERSLGGDTTFDHPLTDIVRLSRAPRSFRVPRRRLIVTTRAGDHEFLIVPKLDSVIERIHRAIEISGGHADVDCELRSEIEVPEDRPDHSAVMGWIHSGWTHVVGLVFWSLTLVAVLVSSRNTVAMAMLAVLIVFSVWRAWAGFRRRARIRRQLAEPPPES